MPQRVVMLTYRKPGMTPESFKDYYENVHVPLIQELAGSAFPTTHTRRYIQRIAAPTLGDGASDSSYTAAVLSGKQDDFAFDAITEMVFEDDTGFERLSEVLAQPDTKERVIADCANFLELSKNPVVLLEDCIASGPMLPCECTFERMNMAAVCRKRLIFM